MNKKVGIITFHAAHNYGSNLQAYALQKTIRNMGVNSEIINFRTERQKDQYRPLTKRKGLKYVIKNAYFMLNYRSRKQKYEIFETFICNDLVKSETEYGSLEQLQKTNDIYTHFISGSDQIWNTAPNDASMAYFLPFAHKSVKIAYAPSFGQTGKLKHKDEIAGYLKSYDFLSVREQAGAQWIYDLTGMAAVPVLVDPTMLIDRDAWSALASENKIEHEYIFFYTLFASKEMIQMVKKLSKQLHMPVVISTITNQYDIFSGFVKKTKTGPKEFLSLIKHAKLVCVSSFHGTVFSILFQKPFFAINGLSDSRIATLLQTVHMEDRAITAENFNEKLNTIFDIDFSQTDTLIQTEKEKAIAYLKEALEL